MSLPKELGRRQVVRHRLLVPTFVGSNPAAPANKKAPFMGVFFIGWNGPVRTYRFGVKPSGADRASIAFRQCRAPSSRPSHSSKIVKNGDFFFLYQAFKLVRMFDAKYTIPQIIFELFAISFLKNQILEFE